MARVLSLTDRRSALAAGLFSVLLLGLGLWMTGSASANVSQETVTLAPGSTVALATPPFIQVGKRYAFSWPGGGPPQTYTVKAIRPDGWVQVDVAEENVDPVHLIPGQVPTRWLHVGVALSVQEMRPLPFQP
jgi:hypothetical protein